MERPPDAALERRPDPVLFPWPGGHQRCGDHYSACLGMEFRFRLGVGHRQLELLRKWHDLRGPPQQVSPGDSILGYMFDTCAAGTVSCSSWDIVTWDLQNGKFSELLMTSSFEQTFNWAFGGVLEVYNVAQCSDYPNQPNGDTGGSNALTFGELLLYSDKFVQIAAPAWSFTNWVGTSATPQCSYGGSVPKQVILHF